jgi:uncharacterized membrane protein YeaQ/YmgE (transglycosylase-associated protein family)
MISFISWIIFGAVIGFIADLIDSKKSGGLIANIIIGILGSIVGGWLAGSVLGIDINAGFNILNIIFSVIGALIVLFIFRLISGDK